MAISSVSRIYDAPDPILETDLDLLAKVNQYQQMKFDAGAEAVQNEVNNWAQMADVAKDQDKQYINAKLTNLVNGINSLGGVNLSDINNVNAIKSLGYNIYGDNKIMNAVSTTRKLRGFMADGQAKMNGKNGKNYDPTLYEYNLNKWNDWLNDGEVGTAFNGPTNLAAGTFDQYQKRITDELSKLQPDMDSLPQGLTDAEKLNYLQVGNKFISKDRVRAAVETATNSNDRELISAHAWRNMSTIPDVRLVGLTSDSYNNKIASLQQQYNSIQDAKNQSQDITQKERYSQQLAALNDSIGTIRNQRNNLMTSTMTGINEDQRRDLRDNLYFDAFKEGLANTHAYTQSKTELKFNQGQAFKLKEARAAYEFAQRQSLAERKLNLQEQALQMKQAMSMMSLYGSSSGQLNANGVLGPAASAPLQLLPVKGDEANVLSANVVKSADENFAAQSQNFYGAAYNYLANNPAYQSSLVKGPDGNFVPKDQESRVKLERALTTKMSQLDKIANLPLTDRQGLTIDDKEEDLLRLSQNLQDARLYQQQVRDLQNKVFESVGLAAPKDKEAKISFNDGTNVTVSYDKFKQMLDTKDPMLEQWKTRSRIVDSGGQSAGTSSMGIPVYSSPRQYSSFDQIKDQVENYYKDDRISKKWKEVSQTFNPMGRNVTLPRFKGVGIPPALTSYFADKVRQVNPSAAVNQDDVDLNRIWVKYDAESPTKVHYMAEVKYRKGNSSSGGKAVGDKLQTVDLTTDVLSDPNGFVSKLYPQDNPQIIYGFMMDTDGKTPFDPSNNYADALKTTSNPVLSHKYQIVTNKNAQNGLESFSVNVLIPRTVGNKTEYYTIPVKNIRNGGTTTFEPNYQYVTQYMNTYFQNPQAVAEFYRLHKIPLENAASASNTTANAPTPGMSTSPTVQMVP